MFYKIFMLLMIICSATITMGDGVVTCAMTTVNNVAFGKYYPLNSNFASTTATIIVKCTNAMSSTQTVGYAVCFTTGSSGT
ncbi:MAG: hypothetical protein ACRYE9_02435, partial [Janthinobacterium lividum]